jgi:hypothetical protein
MVRSAPWFAAVASKDRANRRRAKYFTGSFEFKPGLNALGALSILKIHAANRFIDEAFILVIEHCEIIGKKPIGEFLLSESCQFSILRNEYVC